MVHDIIDLLNRRGTSEEVQSNREIINEYEMLFNSLQQVDIEEVESVHRHAEWGSTRAIEVISGVAEIIVYIFDELIRELSDIRNIESITNMNQRLNGLQPILEFRERAHDEIERDHGDYVHPDTAAQEEHDRIYDIFDGSQDIIIELIEEFLTLYSYVETQI